MSGNPDVITLDIGELSPDQLRLLSEALTDAAAPLWPEPDVALLLGQLIVQVDERLTRSRVPPGTEPTNVTHSNC